MQPVRFFDETGVHSVTFRDLTAGTELTQEVAVEPGPPREQYFRWAISSPRPVSYVGDEVSIPIGVFNYLPQAQEVRLVVEQEPWFELLGEGEQTLTIASNEVEVVYFPVRVQEFGRQGFQVTAWGEQMSDAIRREVRVVPDGKEFALSESGWLRESKEIEIEFPGDVIPGTQHVEVKVYPGMLAQVVEGLEKIIQLPYG